jgi:hypothetical protein
MHVNAVFGAIASFLCIMCGKAGSILEKADFTGFPADSLRAR